MSKHVFISAKSDDNAQAIEIYGFLERAGIAVFFAPKSLPKLGSSEYRKKIDQALDSAEHMVVVTSSRANVESSWVQAEWGFFVNELRSGRKHGNLLTVIVGSLTINELPPALRGFEVIAFGIDAFPKILPYVKSVQRISPIEQEQDADRRVEHVQQQPVDALPGVNRAALADLNTAIDKYENLRGRDDAWSPTFKYQRVGCREPQVVTQPQWLAELRFKLARAYFQRGTVKQDIPSQGQIAAQSDFDLAIAMLELMQDEPQDHDTPRDGAEFHNHVRSLLRMSYTRRADSSDDASEALRYYDKAIQVSEQLPQPSTPEERASELCTLGTLFWGRGDRREKLHDRQGAIVDYSHSLQALQECRQLRPDDPDLVKWIRRLEAMQASVQPESAVGRDNPSWFKKMFG